MKLSRVLCSCSKVAAIIIAALSFSDFGVAATPRDWIGTAGLGGNGNWNTAENWSPAGVPGSGDDANLLPSNGTSASINYDYNGPAVTIGNLNISASPFPRLHPTATLNIAANTLSASQEFVGNSGSGGSGGVGSINQSGGRNNPLGFLYLGYNSTDNGAYTLTAGQLSVVTIPPSFIGDHAENEEDIGYGGAGTFVQSGGTNFTGVLTVGSLVGANGSYTLSGGSLFSDVTIGGYYAAGILRNPTPGGTGVFTISGTGVLNSYSIYVFNTNGSSLNLNGGTISTSYMNVGAPSIFSWTSGTLSITRSTTFDLGSNSSSSWHAFGSALDLGAGQTLSLPSDGGVLSGDEGVGGVDSFLLTVGSGGANSVSGTLTINSNGTLKLNGGTLSAADITNSGKFTINSGSLTTGDVTFGSMSTLQIGLAGNSLGQYGDLTVSGRLALDGSLVVSLNGFSPSSGQSFHILDWGSLVGAFSSLQLPTLAGGLAWNTSQLYTTGLLSVGLLGDFDFNGVVNAADYVVWRKGLGTTYTQNDYSVWRSQFGQLAGSGAGTNTNAAVPEPATLVLLTLAGAGWCIRRGKLSRVLCACSKFAAVVVVALSFSEFAMEANARNWIGPNGLAGSGNWNAAGNWSPAGVPGSGDDANLLPSNGTSASINYDYNGPAVTIGNLNISASPFPRLNPTATLNIASNTLTANNEFIGNSGAGGGGVGAINQSGGNNTSYGSLYLGYNATDNGAYTLSGTTQLSVTSGKENVGYGGTATFSQSGGTNNTAYLLIGVLAGSSGTYTLSGNAVLNTSTLVVGGNSAGLPASPTAGGTGVLTVSGTSKLYNGTINVFNTTGSSLNLSGGTIRTSQIVLHGDPSLFNWTTGTLDITSSAIFEPGPLHYLSSWTTFGNALTLGTSQTLSLTGDEQIGNFDSFLLTVGLGGTSSLSGKLTINSLGTLQLNGGTLIAADIVNNGTFTINSGSMMSTDIVNNGTFTINSGSMMTTDVTLNSTSMLQIGLAGNGLGQYGALSASRYLALDGSLVVSLSNFVPSAGQSFHILDFGDEQIGTFSALQLPALATGLVWNISQLYWHGLISVDAAVSPPGDFNSNGIVDAADYVVWRKGLGTTYTQNDYNVWRTHFGQSAGSGAGALANATVPEPAVSMQIILACVVFSLRRRWGA